MGRGLRWDEARWTEHQKRRADVSASPPAPEVSKKSSPPIQSPVSPKKAADPLARFHALGRLAKGVMNKTETAYSVLLDQRMARGEILAWRFHPMNIRLARSTFYEVDFLVLAADLVLEIHETKGGFVTDKGQMKIKLAAEALPFFRMFKAIRQTKKQGGGFEIQDFSA